MANDFRWRRRPRESREERQAREARERQLERGMHSLATRAAEAAAALPEDADAFAAPAPASAPAAVTDRDVSPPGAGGSTDFEASPAPASRTTRAAAPHWFEAMADFMGGAYLRYSFTRGTEQEVTFLSKMLDLQPGKRVLDVGCGPGRHAYALAQRGIDVVGVDISKRFVDIANAGAPPGAVFVRADAQQLDFDGVFDAVISICQGGFGLAGDDEAIIANMARALKPGGLLAITAFSAYFFVRNLEEGDEFDASSGVNHERTNLRNEAGDHATFDMWTTCMTPRELRLMARGAGLSVRNVWSVAPGAYSTHPPSLERPELLLVAERPK